jgi:hypothetical protein
MRVWLQPIEGILHLTNREAAFVDFLSTKLFLGSREHLRWTSACLKAERDNVSNLAMKGLAAAFFARGLHFITIALATERLVA